MRVAWDLQAVTGPRPTGLGISVGFLLDACIHLAPDVHVIGLRPNDENRALIGVADRLKWEQWRLPGALSSLHAKEPIDLCYSPALGAPMRSPVPVVAHVHDLIPMLYPQQFTGIAGWYWKSMLPRSWKKCRALTVSNATVASDAAEYLDVPREQIHIVPYYPDPDIAAAAKAVKFDFADIEPGDASDTPVFITLGSHEERKNIELAIRGIGLLHEEGVAARLICVGGHSPYTEVLKEFAWKCSAQDFVEFPGYLDRKEVVSLMLKCTALIFVSRYEGYGMPPLEAMSIGCATVLSNIPCHRQVYGDSEKWAALGEGLEHAPEFIMPDDDQALAEEMQKLIEDRNYRAQLRRSGLAYAKTFTAAATAAALGKAFKSALG